MDRLQTTGDESKSEKNILDNPKEPEPPKPAELWAMAMKLIEAENSLINHRLTWFLGIQAFLGVALGLVVGNARFASFQTLAILMIAAFGLVFVVVNAPGIQAARRQITAADSWLRKTRSNPGYIERCPYPPPKGIKAEIRIFGRRITDKPDEESYDPSYELTDQETQPDYTQFGFANFPDVIFVFWAVVIVWAVISELTGTAGKAQPLPTTVLVTGSANPGVAVTDPKNGETVARVSIVEVAPKRMLMIELQDLKPPGRK